LDFTNTFDYYNKRNTKIIKQEILSDQKNIYYRELEKNSKDRDEIEFNTAKSNINKIKFWFRVFKKKKK